MQVYILSASMNYIHDLFLSELLCQWPISWRFGNIIKIFQHSPLGHSEPLHEQYFQMESAPDLQMTIVLTLCLLYKIISTEAISAIAIEVVNKTHTHRHIYTHWMWLFWVRGRLLMSTSWFTSSMKSIERYIYLYIKNLGFDPDNY